MTKSLLIAKVAENTGLKKKDAEAAIDTAFELIEDSLVAGEKVQIAGFGTFEVKERRPRNGRNPYTGEAMVIGPTKHISFGIGKILKEKIR